jgi:uncharacterized protein YbjT (DUF2867 family)
MKVLLTGASGYIGSATLDALVAAGHDVVGVVRSESKADGVRERGAIAAPGDITDPTFLRELAATVDGRDLGSRKRRSDHGGDSLSRATDHCLAPRNHPARPGRRWCSKLCNLSRYCLWTRRCFVACHHQWPANWLG